MQLRNVSDNLCFRYCKVKALKEFQYKKTKISIGDIMYAMLYPNRCWTLFNTTDESTEKQVELSNDAKNGIDFEPIET